MQFWAYSKCNYDEQLQAVFGVLAAYQPTTQSHRNLCELLVAAETPKRQLVSLIFTSSQYSVSQKTEEHFRWSEQQYRSGVLQPCQHIKTD